MKLKRTMAMILAAVVLVSSGVPAVANAGTKSYTAYSLSRFKGDKFTSLYNKTSNDTYIKNKVTALTDTTYINAWAVTSGNKKISKKYKQSVETGTKKIKFTSSTKPKKGDEIGLGMENYNNASHYAWVSGKVDFR